MPKKKRLFSKDNCTKYLLLPGKVGACNADGEILETLLVPVPNNHKPGSSLFFPKFENIQEEENSASILKFAPASNYSDKQEVHTYDKSKEPDLNKILEEFDDAEFDDDDDEYDDDEEEDCESNDDEEVQNNPDNISFMTQFNNLNVSGRNTLFKQRSTNHVSKHPQIEDDHDKSYSSAESDQFSDAEELVPTRSKYLLTSAKQDCPESLKILNEQFEKILEDYDDDQIGALDDEEIGGHLTTDSKLLDGYILSNPEKELELGKYDSDIKEQILKYAEQDDEVFVEIVTKAPIEFDCESILSTYSNIYNHPAVIKEESKIKKIKIPDNPLKKRLLKSQLKQLEKECDEDLESDDEVSVITSFNVRSKSETPEEKKERKKLFKEAKRESRMLKKENKLAFKEEKKLQTAQMINANNNRGIRLL